MDSFQSSNQPNSIVATQIGVGLLQNQNALQSVIPSSEQAVDIKAELAADTSVPVKRGKGRPKGSLNKRTIQQQLMAVRGSELEEEKEVPPP